MGFLRRLLGGERSGTGATPDAGTTVPVDAQDLDAAEKAYELDLLREDQARMSDLVQRQLRYAEYAWTPPAQGGERRADDGDDAGDAAEERPPESDEPA
jgi:hypothetical protein